MPDHEFDKALGEKASSLLVEPSPAVWEAVAARLKEKKRRRAIIWWFSGAPWVTQSTSCPSISIAPEEEEGESPKTSCYPFSATEGQKVRQGN